MKKVLKELLDSKENLYKVQRFFVKTLEQRYPNIVLKDTEDFEKKINDELEFLLSSCVKHKTGRILIDYPSGRKKELVLTRNPGLKFPHESYQVFSLVDVKGIDKEKNLLSHNNREKVFTGRLQNSGQIDQEKFREFLKFLKKVIVWKENVDQVISDRYGDKGIFVPVGKHRMKIFHQNFELGILNPEKGKQTYSAKWLEIQSYQIPNYSADRGWDQQNQQDKGEITDQEMLIQVWRKFKDFDRALKREEKVKGKLIKEAEKLLEDLISFNRPFKVLIKLING